MNHDPGLDRLAAEIFVRSVRVNPGPWSEADALIALERARSSFECAAAFERERLSRKRSEVVAYVPREVVTELVETLEGCLWRLGQVDPESRTAIEAALGALKKATK